MGAIDLVLEQRLDSLSLPLAVVLPGGRRIGNADAAVTLRLHDLSPLAHIAAGADRPGRARTTSKAGSTSTATCAT